MRLIVDSREQEVYGHLKSMELPSHIQLETQSLPLGDFLVCDENETAMLLYERKSFSDLFASIKDGRYEEQSFRLQNDARFPNKKDIVYVLEGMYSQLKQRSDKKLLASTMTSLMFFKGFSVMRTSSPQDTAEWMIHMIDKIHRDTSKGKVRYGGVSSSSSSSSNIDSNNHPEMTHTTETPCYSSVVKSVKKENVTKENIGTIMLCQIPGISSKIASAIMEQVNHSFTNLIQMLKYEPEKIENLKIGDKPRKISKTIVPSLKSFLLDPEPISESDQEPNPDSQREPEPEPEPKIQS